MQRALPILAAAGALLVGPWLSPAQAAAAGVSNVRISWYDAAHTKVKITWSETTAVANTVKLSVALEPVLGTTTADQPNELVADADKFPYTYADGRQSVVVTAPDGTSARSVDFDSYTYAPGPEKLALTFPSYDSLRWTLGKDDSVDGTPGDPLDLPVRYRYLVTQEVDPDPGSWGNWECTPRTTTTVDVPTGTLAKSDRPYLLRVRPQNEWGTSGYGANKQVARIAGVRIAAPTATPYGGTTRLTGQVTEMGLVISGSPPTCDEHRYAAALTTVIVHQRTSPTAPWTVVGTTRTDQNGNYTATFRNPGHRQYRVVVANRLDETRFGADSATVAVRAITRVVSAKFINPVVNLGTQPQAYLWVDPAGSQRAALQFKNASGAWQGVAYKTLYAGRGILTFPWNRRGSTQFRWWVPATATADATYSGVFTLTVR